MKTFSGQRSFKDGIEEDIHVHAPMSFFVTCYIL